MKSMNANYTVASKNIAMNVFSTGALKRRICVLSAKKIQLNFEKR